MKNLLLSHRQVLYGWFRGNAPALSEQELSQTISLARISLIVGLVFLHYEEYPNSRSSPFDGLDLAQHQAATFINSFVLFFFFSVVPLLSMVSGWLFFSFPGARAATSLHQRIRGRFFTLYLPLIFWNTLFLLILLWLSARQPGHPILDHINIRFEHADWFDYLNAIFGIAAHPVGSQFWFLRDLFVTVLLSPLLWLLLRRAPYVGIAGLGFAWLIGHDLYIFFRTDVVFFFYLGGFLRMYKVPLEMGRHATLILLAVYVALVALRALAPVAFDTGDPRPQLLTLATRPMRLVGVLACWGLLIQLTPTRLGTMVARYGGMAFFLYAAHFPLLAGVKILLWRWVPAETDAWMVAHYAASVATTVTVAISAGLLLSRATPSGFALMNGGRHAFAASRTTVPSGMSRAASRTSIPHVETGGRDGAHPAQRALPDVD